MDKYLGGKEVECRGSRGGFGGGKYRNERALIHTTDTFSRCKESLPLKEYLYLFKQVFAF